MKSGERERYLWQILEKEAPTKNDFFEVLRISKCPIFCHIATQGLLACQKITKDDLFKMLRLLKSHGLRHIVALWLAERNDLTNVDLICLMIGEKKLVRRAWEMLQERYITPTQLKLIIKNVRNRHINKKAREMLREIKFKEKLFSKKRQ